MKVLRNLSEKLGAKFPSTIRGYSMAKFACLNDASWEVFEGEVSPVEGQSVRQKDKKRRKRKGKKSLKENKKPIDIGHFLVEKSPNFDFCACLGKCVVKHDASGKKGMLSCCKCYFKKIRANLAHIQSANL